MLKKEQYLKTVRRPYPPLFSSLVMMGYANKKFFEGLLNESYALTNMAHFDGTWYYSFADFEKGGQLAIIAWRSNPLFKFVKNEFKRRADNLVDSATKNFDDFCQAYQEYMPALALIVAVEKQIEAALKVALSEKLKVEEVENLMYGLNIPLQDNFYKQEEHDLITSLDLKTHVEKYKWLNVRYGEEREYTLQEAETKLKGIDKGKFLEKWDTNKKELRKTIANTKKLLADKSWLVDVFQYIIYYRTHRTDIINKSAFLAIPMLKAKALSLNISYEQLLRCSAEEVLSNKIPSQDVLDSRIKDCSTISEDGRVFLLDGTESRKLVKFFKEDLGTPSEIKGNIACKGNVKGKVKLVFGNKDFTKIETGDILVTSMTTPEMVQIMKKVAAFVTDEGGITCHAAIISREMNKPCIIGTKIATQVLKDGDLVEVDADKGVVKILERASNNTKSQVVQSRPVTTLTTSPQTNTNIIDKKNWHVFRNRYIPAVLPILSYWSWPVKDVVGKNIGLVVNVWDKGQYQAIWEEKGYQTIRDYSFDFLLSHIKNSQLIRKRGMIAGLKTVDVCKKFAAGVDVATLDDFADFFKILDKTYNEFTKRSMLLWLFLGDVLQAEIKKELSKISKEKQSQVFSELSVSDEKSYSHKEEEKFWKIVELAKVKGINNLSVKKAIKKFSDEYYWFPYEYVGPEIWNVSSVKKRVAEALFTNSSVPTNKIYKETNIRVSKKIKNLFAVLRAVTLMQDDRKMINAQVCYYLNGIILKELAKKINVPLGHIRYLETDLFNSLLDGHLDKTAIKKELHKRADFCVIVQNAEQHQVYTGFSAKEKLKELGVKEEINATDEILHGHSAYKGNVVGRVKIIHSSSNGKNFSEGDVLVTGMTTPDFVPIVKRASAIITNEGGITCHAAIVARELHIPCIIGTKIATQVLKDGDLVEVDADKGVVKILKRKK